MYLGIDLGTSNSAVVGNLDGTTRLLKTADGLDVLPSAIYLDRRGHRFVGKTAMDRLISAPGSVAQGFKRLMGTKSHVKIGEQEWSPEDCSAEIIRTLVGQAMTETGAADASAIEGAVITIPAAFNQMQSEATIDAARRAGLDRVSLLQEPVAAAMAAIAHSRQKDGVFLVYDLGGGTFDVALVLSTAGSVTIVAHEGINMLGGRDFDRIIVDSIVRPWLHANFNLPETFQKEAAWQHLATVARHAAERAKIQLSTSPSASIFANEDEVRAKDLDGQEIYISVEMTRDAMVDLVRDRIEDTIRLCRKVIADNGYNSEDISRIVPIGGPSKMPVVRAMLQTELAILVEQGLDPMTAVATGAAIFAESREWTDGGSSRKAARGQETVTGAVSLAFDFSARVSDESVRLRIRPNGDIPAGVMLEVADEEGGSSGRVPVDGAISLTLRARKFGTNLFRVRVYDAAGNLVEEASKDLTVVRTQASAASIPMTYTLAVKIQKGEVGCERNVVEAILKKGASLPAEGKHSFRAGKMLKGGDDDYIAFEFYQMVDRIDDPSLNLYIGDFRLQGQRDLERGERIARGDEVIVHWKMSDNGTLSFSVELPKLGRLVDAHNLYLMEVAEKNFDGPKGADMASTLLAGAEQDLDELDGVLDGQADRDGTLRSRIERQHAALSASVDAETNRSASEEARRLRQEIALLRMAPENEERVLLHELEAAEAAFDELQDDAAALDAERHERLLLSARRSLREHDFEAVRRSLAEMGAIRTRLLLNRPGFLLAVFEQLGEDRSMAADEVQHDQLVAAGEQAIERGDFDGLRGVIRMMIQNSTRSGGQASEIVELAHLLGR